MTRRPHLQRSSKESRVRHYNVLAVAHSRLLMRSIDCFARLIDRSGFSHL